MLSEQRKNKLIENRPLPKENIGKMLGRLARYLHLWHEEKNPYPEVCRITPSIGALLNNIELDGSQNKDLAKCAFTSKQAMSKLLIQSERDGIIEIEKNVEDSRANNITITNSGADLLLAIWNNNRKLIEEFETQLGKEKAQQLLNLLFELSERLEIKNR
jgi:DNA-binding MarR family transcriptional regulator